MMIVTSSIALCCNVSSDKIGDSRRRRSCSRSQWHSMFTVCSISYYAKLKIAVSHFLTNFRVWLSKPDMSEQIYCTFPNDNFNERLANF